MREKRKRGPHIKSIFGLKIGLSFHHMFVLYLYFYYIFDKFKKPNIYLVPSLHLSIIPGNTVFGITYLKIVLCK